ncbi:MAG: hypothetical protein ACREYF_00830 [Gammaproteobacteria bacterium]
MMKQAGVFLLALALVMGAGVPAQTGLSETKPRVQADDSAQEKSVAKKYPPYPDVWGYSDPKGLGELCKADNGDFYLVSTTVEQADTGSPYRRITALFSRSIIKVSPKEAEEVWRYRKPLAGVGTLNCYGVYNHETRTPHDYPRSLNLREGLTVRQACFHSQGLCDYPYYTIGIEVRDKDQRIVARKIFLYLLKVPSKKYLPAPKVVDIAGEIMERVNQLEPKLVPLEDETFLVNAGGVFRFDRQLRTQFPINEDRLFMIEPSLIEAIYNQADQSSDPGSLAWHQAVQDATAELLTKLKKEKRQ